MLRFDRDFFQSFELSEIESISLSGGKNDDFCEFFREFEWKQFSVFGV